MRQLRLRETDREYAFLFSGEGERAEALRVELCRLSDTMGKHSFAENPATVQIQGRGYAVGFVHCCGETVVPLPERGDVFILKEEGGFLVAAETESKEPG